jgi:sec-independent protein translocase protein TatC
MSSPANHEEPGPEQPFISHLVELRDRILRMLVAVLAVFLVLFPFANEIYIYVAAPLMAQLPEGTSMIATQVASPFLTPFKLALVAAVFLSMPYLLYQFWAFVAPGLYQHEKRFAVPLVVSSIVLFYLGMAFAYYVVFPLVFAFLTGTAPEGVAVMTDITAYLDFVLTLFFAFGIAFEIPIATILLVSVGITTPEDLRKKRPYVIVGVFVAGMLLTPPDVISQTLLAFPMWLLFELGIFFSRFFLRRGEANREESDSDYAVGAAASGGGGLAARGSDDSPLGGGPPDSPPGEGIDVRSGGDSVVGRGISGGDPFDTERFRPMTPEEMEAELDAIESDEDIEPPDESTPDPVAQKLQRVMELRDDEDEAGARALLYEVLADGDDDQRGVARNILAQLDQP